MSLRTKINLVLTSSICISTFLGISTTVLANVRPPADIENVYIGIIMSLVTIFLFVVVNKKLTPIVNWLDTKSQDLEDRAAKNIIFIEKFYMCFMIALALLGPLLGLFNRPLDEYGVILLAGPPQLCFYSFIFILLLKYVLEKDTGELGIEKINLLGIKTKIIVFSIIFPLGASLIISYINVGYFFKVDKLTASTEDSIDSLVYSVKMDATRGVSNEVIKQKILDATNFNKNKELSEKTKNILVIGNVVAIFFVIAIYFIMRKTIYNPIKGVHLGFKTLASTGNNLSQEMPVTAKDEIGQLCHYFNSFVGKLSLTINDIKEITEKVESISSNVLKISDSTGMNMNNIKTETFELNSNIEGNLSMAEELISLINSIEVSSKQLSEKSNELLNLSLTSKNNAEAGKSVIDSTIEKIKVIDSSINNYSRNISDLANQSQQITSVVETISGISKQTNLLSLNAAIEAARAGEAGKGFSVVADEIRKLSESSSNSIKMVSNIVENIKNSSETAVIQMKNDNQNIEDSIKSIREMGSLIIDTIQSFMEINNKIKAFYDVVTAEVNAVDNIQKCVESVAASTELQSRKSSNISSVISEEDSTINDLRVTSERLDNIIKELRVAVEKISTEI